MREMKSDLVNALRDNSDYFYARLSDQFDAVLHFDQTRAVEPLERVPEWTMEELHEPAETFPSGV